MARIKFMNTEIDNLTMREALAYIDYLIQQDKNAFVVTPNVDHIVRLEHDSEMQEVYRQADLILTDGKPLIWISKWYGTPIKEKVSGSDLFPQLCQLAAKKGYTMFFLGAAEGIAEKAADKLATKYPGLEVVGTYAPPLYFEHNLQEMQKINGMVSALRPDILVVSLNCPRQEYFMLRNKDKLGVPITLGLGASLDFEAGNIKRAPKWMSEHGFEWLYRVIQEPKRLFKRYFIDDSKIFLLAIKYKFKKKVG